MDYFLIPLKSKRIEKTIYVVLPVSQPSCNFRYRFSSVNEPQTLIIAIEKNKYLLDVADLEAVTKILPRKG